MARQPRPAFGSKPLCLHCALWEMINAASPRDAAGQAMYDGQQIISDLSEVIAEVIAAHPIPEVTLAGFLPQMAKLVREKVASGEHPGRNPSLHAGSEARN